MDFVQLISAAGIGGIIGSLITTTLQAWFARQTLMSNRTFQEKKEAYTGFLEALHRSEVEQTSEASLRAGHWQNRCELVASKQVRLLITRVFETNPRGGSFHPDRPRVIAELKQAMRMDLGIEKND